MTEASTLSALTYRERMAGVVRDAVLDTMPHLKDRQYDPTQTLVDMGADYLDHIEILMEIEECLQLEIAEDARAFKSPRDIEDYLVRLHEQADLQEDNKLLRQLLAHAYSGSHLYMDDGELQDNFTAPFIDYRRDSVVSIQAAMQTRGIAALQEIQLGTPTQVATDEIRRFQLKPQGTSTQET